MYGKRKSRQHYKAESRKKTNQRLALATGRALRHDDLKGELGCDATGIALHERFSSLKIWIYTTKITC